MRLTLLRLSPLLLLLVACAEEPAPSTSRTMFIPASALHALPNPATYDIAYVRGTESGQEVLLNDKLVAKGFAPGFAGPHFLYVTTASGSSEKHLMVDDKDVGPITLHEGSGATYYMTNTNGHYGFYRRENGTLHFFFDGEDKGSVHNTFDACEANGNGYRCHRSDGTTFGKEFANEPALAETALPDATHPMHFGSGFMMWTTPAPNGYHDIYLNGIKVDSEQDIKRSDDHLMFARGNGDVFCDGYIVDSLWRNEHFSIMNGACVVQSLRYRLSINGFTIGYGTQAVVRKKLGE